jgi:hypothetical protein
MITGMSLCDRKGVGEMDPTIHDIGRPTIRSSRPSPPQEEGREWVQMGKRGDGEANKERNTRKTEDEEIPQGG